MASTITIIQQPQDLTANLRSFREDVAPASFSVLVTAVTADGPQSGSPVTATYQWQRSTGGAFSNISGATDATYNVDVPVTASGYGYRVRVSASGATTVNSASAVLTVENQYAQYATATESGSARYGRLYAAEII